MKRTARLIVPFLCCGLATLTVGCREEIDTHFEFAELARHHERRGELEKAVDAFNKANELDDEYSDTWYDLGVIYAELDQVPEAIQAYSKAIEIDAAFAMAYNNRASLYARQEEFDKAIADYSTAVTLQPGDAMAWRNRGLAYQDQGNLTQALQDFTESIHRDGMSGETYHYRGMVFLDQQRYERAVEDFREAWRLDGFLTDAMVKAAEAYARMGRMPQARAAFQQAAAFGEDVPDLDLTTFLPSSVAEPASASPAAVAFARTQVEQQSPTQDADAPWSFAVDSGDGKTLYLVKELVASNSGTAISLSSEELSLIDELHDSSVTLLVVASQGLDSSQYHIAAELPDWQPDNAPLSPEVWSLPVIDAAPREEAEILEIEELQIDPLDIESVQPVEELSISE